MINKSKIKEKMRMQSASDRINNFDKVELGYNDTEALNEALRCLNCKNKPCVQGCPVGVAIPTFIQKIVEKDAKSAYEIITKDNIFPAICGRVCPQERQCEAMCVRGKTGESVGIGRLERYVADKNISKTIDNKVSLANTNFNGYKIAVIGSGPSGLTCASKLADFGYNVTIYEALHRLGGVLAYGIPEFRLPRKILNYEINKLVQKGINMKTNMIIGKILTINDLFSLGYKAIYISTGAGLPKFMNIPGEGLAGIYAANEFLSRINLMQAHLEEYDTPIVKPKKVVVVGGGNVAMDAARCAKRLGAENVTIIYRRTENEMPARKDEILHAKEENINFLFLSNPVNFIGKNGKVTELEYIKMKLSKPDESGRKSVISESDQKHKIEADTVIIAIGNAPNSLVTDTNSGIEINSKGCIVADNSTMRTSRPYVYAGGDIATGAATVILAMGAGKRAAAQIHKDISAKS